MYCETLDANGVKQKQFIFEFERKTKLKMIAIFIQRVFGGDAFGLHMGFSRLFISVQNSSLVAKPETRLQTRHNRMAATLGGS